MGVEPVRLGRGTLHDRGLHGGHRLVTGLVVEQVPSVQVSERWLFDETQEIWPPAVDDSLGDAALAKRAVHMAGRKLAKGVLVVMAGQAELLEVVGTLHAVGRL